VDNPPAGEIEMKNYRCSLCSHVSCMGCANRTWKTMNGNVVNLVCCQCGADQLLTCWFEISVASPRKATRTTYPDLFEEKETKI
jgi:hypothetical protein